jgi:hypothetical protein
MKKWILIVVALAISILLFVYIKEPKLDSKNTVVENVQATSSPLTIEQIKNAEIPDYTGFTEDDNAKINLKNGAHELDVTDSGVSFHTEALLDTDPTSYTIADLNSDGSDDIVTTIGWSGGGSGFFTELTVFINDKGNPKYLTSTSIGDRITVNRIFIQNGIINADIITQGPNELLCCGTMRTILRYKLVGNELVEAKD